MNRSLLFAFWCAAVAPPLAGAQERVVVASVFGTVPADTIQLDLAEARRLAIETNPDFLLERERIAIARGEARQARTYPFNPQIEAEARALGSQGRLEAYETTVSQEIEWAGQSGLRRRAGLLRLDRTRLEVEDAARTLLAEVDRAYFSAVAAGRRASIADTVLRLNARLAETVRIQLREGELSVLEANLAGVEFGRARALVLTTRREAIVAGLDLKRLVGLAPDVPVTLESDAILPLDRTAFDQEALIAQALAQRPDLAARRTAVAERAQLASLARREALPNLTIAGLAEQEAEDDDPLLGLAIGLPFPLWNRNQGTVDQRRAETRQAAHALTSATLRVRTEVSQAYQTYAAAREAARVFESDVLGPARENQVLLDIAYREGKIDLAALLLLRNQLLDAELGYWDAWLAAQQAFVDLRSATAEIAAPESSFLEEGIR